MTTIPIPSTRSFLLAVAVVGLRLFLVPVYPSNADAQGRRKKITFGDEDTEEIEGYVHKPEVGYIITRQEQEDLETLQLKESFIPKIVKSVETKPF